jgi:hypothetical protein
MGRRAPITFFVSVAIASLCASVALGSQPSGAELHATARTLIPPTVRVVRQRDANCGEGLRFPSCVDVYFQDRGSLRKRVAAFIVHARAKGWTTTFRGSAGGERVYLLRRRAYKGRVGFWIDKYYHPTLRCDAGDITRNSPATCAEHFQVEVAANR